MFDDKQRNISTEDTPWKTKDWETQTPPKAGDEFRCSERVSRTCSVCGTRRVNHVISYRSLKKTYIKKIETVNIIDHQMMQF